MAVMWFPTWPLISARRGGGCVPSRHTAGGQERLGAQLCAPTGAACGGWAGPPYGGRVNVGTLALQNGRRPGQEAELLPNRTARRGGGYAAYAGYRPALPRTATAGRTAVRPYVRRDGRVTDRASVLPGKVTAWAGHEGPAPRETATVPKPFGPGWRPLRDLATGGDRCPRPTGAACGGWAGVGTLALQNGRRPGQEAELLPNRTATARRAGGDQRALQEAAAPPTQVEILRQTQDRPVLPRTATAGWRGYASPTERTTAGAGGRAPAERETANGP